MTWKLFKNRKGQKVVESWQLVRDDGFYLVRVSGSEGLAAGELDRIVMLTVGGQSGETLNLNGRRKVKSSLGRLEDHAHGRALRDGKEWWKVSSYSSRFA